MTFGPQDVDQHISHACLLVGIFFKRNPRNDPRSKQRNDPSGQSQQNRPTVDSTPPHPQLAVLGFPRGFLQPVRL